VIGGEFQGRFENGKKSESERVLGRSEMRERERERESFRGDLKWEKE
jgi:hypothetical protein